MYNDSYIVENGWDQLYERSETISQPKDCPECEGTGKDYYTVCCGADMLNGICTDCKEPAYTDYDQCSVCKGEGEIYND